MHKMICELQKEMKELYEDRIKHLEKQVEELKAVNEYKNLTYVTKKMNFEYRLVKKISHV